MNSRIWLRTVDDSTINIVLSIIVSVIIKTKRFIVKSVARDIIPSTALGRSGE